MERPAGLPSWEELIRLPEAEARKLLEPLVTQYDDETLGEWFGVSGQRVGYLRRKLGLEKMRGRGTNSLRRTESGGGNIMGRTPPADVALGLPQGTLEIALSGRFARDELFRKLEKLRTVVELLDTRTFSVSIQISEVADNLVDADEGDGDEEL